MDEEDDDGDTVSASVGKSKGKNMILTEYTGRASRKTKDIMFKIKVVRNGKSGWVPLTKNKNIKN